MEDYTTLTCLHHACYDAFDFATSRKHRDWHGIRITGNRKHNSVGPPRAKGRDHDTQSNPANESHG